VDVAAGQRRTLSVAISVCQISRSAHFKAALRAADLKSPLRSGLYSVHCRLIIPQSPAVGAASKLRTAGDAGDDTGPAQDGSP